MQAPDKVSTIHVTGEFTPTSPLQLYSTALDENTPSVKYDDGIPVIPRCFVSEHEGRGFSVNGNDPMWCRLKSVSFASSDGNIVYSSAYANAEGLVAATDAPTPFAQEGYSLIGWKLKGAANDDLWDFSHDKVSENDTVLTAVWRLDAPELTVDAKTTKLHEGSEGAFELVARPTHSVSNITYTFTWKRSGAVIPGATGATLATDEPGVYTVVVTADDGTLISDAIESTEIVCSIEPHVLVRHNAKSPTCTETGWEAYDECSECGYSTFKEIPAIGHSWGEDGRCTACGTVNPDFLPTIIAGANASWQRGNDKDLAFTSNAAYGDFQKVQVGGKDVDAADYTVEEGSTIVTLKAPTWRPSPSASTRSPSCLIPARARPS